MDMPEMTMATPEELAARLKHELATASLISVIASLHLCAVGSFPTQRLQRQVIRSIVLGLAARVMDPQFVESGNLDEKVGA